MVKSKKLFALAATVILGATMLTGCSQEVKDAQAKIDSTTINALNQSQIVREITDVDFENFTFLGADFQRDAENLLDVEVSGIAEYNDSEKAFVNFTYENVDENFADVEASDKAAIIHALSSVIQNKDISEFEFTPVSSAAVINDTLKDIAECPVDGYNFCQGMAFSVGQVEFNKEEGYVSFQVKSNIDYSKTRTEVGYGITHYVQGKPQYGTLFRTKTYHDDYLHTHKIYLKVNEKEMQAMQADKSLIFDKFYSSVKDNDKSSYVVKSVKVESAQEFDTKMINDVDYKDL